MGDVEGNPSAAVSGDVGMLRARLEQALRRVETLEQRLGAHELERKGRRNSKQVGGAHSDSLESDEHVPVVEAQPYPTWNAQDLFQEQTGSQSVNSGQRRLGSTPVYLHRPFNFEEFRRANSSQLQSERLRVLFPSDHMPFLAP